MDIYGQESPGWISLLKLVFFFKYSETSLYLVKLIGQWIPDRDGQEIARDIKKKIFSFSKLDRKWLQNLDNLNSWNVEKGPNFVNCPNFITIFCHIL